MDRTFGSEFFLCPTFPVVGFLRFSGLRSRPGLWDLNPDRVRPVTRGQPGVFPVIFTSRNPSPGRSQVPKCPTQQDHSNVLVVNDPQVARLSRCMLRGR